MQEVWIILTIKPVFHDIENFSKDYIHVQQGLQSHWRSTYLCEC